MEEVKDLKFGGVLRNIRTSRNMSIREFGQTCNISIAYICDLENSKRKATLQVIDSVSSNLNLTEEENNDMINAYSCDRLQIPVELFHYLIDNELLTSLNVLREHNKEGNSIKKLAKKFENKGKNRSS